MYTAIICKPKYSKLEGSDNLLVANIFGYTVLTNKDTDTNKLKIFFPSGGTINEKFLSLTNSFRSKYEKNVDPNHPGGFFETNGRITAIRMRGTKSEGVLFPLESLELLNIDSSKLKKDDNISILKDRDGVEIILCQKYVPSHFVKVKGEFNHNLFLSPKSVPNFEQHFDTPQLRQNTRSIPDGADLYLTEKWHGTSGRTAKTLFFIPLKPWQKKWNYYADKINCNWAKIKEKKEYRIVSGTRRTILKPDAMPYYRKVAEELLTPHLDKEMTIYYEIVGYEVKEKEQLNPSLFFTHKVSKKDQKDLHKLYGETAKYTYGCYKDDELLPFAVYVYRIKTRDSQGNDFEFTPEEIVDFVVHTIQNPNIVSISPIKIWENFQQSDENIEKLINIIERQIKTYHKNWTDHPSEGACLRIVHPQIPIEKSIMKWKSFEFSQLEDIAYSNPNYKDIEEEC